MAVFDNSIEDEISFYGSQVLPGKPRIDVLEHLIRTTLADFLEDDRLRPHPSAAVG